MGELCHLSKGMGNSTVRLCYVMHYSRMQVMSKQSKAAAE